MKRFYSLLSLRIPPFYARARTCTRSLSLTTNNQSATSSAAADQDLFNRCKKMLKHVQHDVAPKVILVRRGGLFQDLFITSTGMLKQVPEKSGRGQHDVVPTKMLKQVPEKSGRGQHDVTPITHSHTHTPRRT